MPHIGATELIILLVIVLLIFGVGKLPEIGSALGKGIREFRKETTSGGDGPKQEAKTNAEASEASKKS